MVGALSLTQSPNHLALARQFSPRRDGDAPGQRLRYVAREQFANPVEGRVR